jgi:RNA polymerase sigma-70 factor (ECF subfamily)
VIRRERTFVKKQPQIIAFIEQWSEACNPEDSPAFDHEIRDGRLRLMFACCHPRIPQDDQIALALRTLCGFSAAEIAMAFLTTEAAIAKRLTRARQRIREADIPFEIPAGEEVAQRLDGVLRTLYLLFNEGYKASSGERLVREELCHEATRLTILLAGHPMGNQPRVHALAALMLFNGARLPARLDGDGNVLRLMEQDRSAWDRRMIARGMFHLAQSAAGEDLGEYHLQAGIAACHCVAANYESTNWRQILSLYDRLVGIDDSPVVALNRAVAVAQVHGPEAGIEAAGAIRGREALDSYYLYSAVMGELEMRRKDFAAAAGHLRKAVRLAGVRSEQIFLSNRLRECEMKRRERRDRMCSGKDV